MKLVVDKMPEKPQECIFFGKGQYGQDCCKLYELHDVEWAHDCLLTFREECEYLKQIKEE